MDNEKDKEDPNIGHEGPDDLATTTLADERQLSFEPEPFVSALSSPRQLQRSETLPPEPRAQGTGKVHPRLICLSPTRSWISFSISRFIPTLPIEPQRYEEAINNPIYGKEWKLAIKKEYNSLMKNGAWELVDLPQARM